MAMMCRRISDVSRQRDGFVALTEILDWSEPSRKVEKRPAVGDIESIVRVGGGNHKLRFERGTMNNGGRALRTSQGHSANAGVTFDYLPRLKSPGWVVHGSKIGKREEHVRTWLKPNGAAPHSLG